MTALTGWLTDDSDNILTDDAGNWLSEGDIFFPGPSAPVTASYRLDVCNNFVRVGVCDVFTFAGVERRNQTGEWEATIPVGGIEFEADATIADVDSIIVWDISTTVATIVAAGLIVPTGSVTTGIITSVGASGTRWTLSGVDLFGVLGTRVAYPTPTSGPPWVDGYDERTDVASTVAAGYINDNMGSSALADRVIPDLTVVDSGVGDSITWTARLQPVSTLVTQICNAAEIVCRARMAVPGVIEYVLTTGADRTAGTVISDHDLTGGITVTEATARATHVIAGGSGETTSRLFSTADTGATGLDRLESFYDVANLTSASAVDLAAQGSLAEQSAETAVDFETLLPRVWRYRTDFDIGDTITVEVDAVRYTCLVDAVAFTITAQKSSVRPLLGRTTNNEAAQIMRELWGTTARFNTTIS